MHCWRLAAWAVALAMLVGASASGACAQSLALPPHPRLIVYGTDADPTRLEELRSQVDEVGAPELWSERKQRLVLAFRSLRAGAWYWHGLNLEAEWDEAPIQQDEQYRCLATLALTDLLMKEKGARYPEYADGRIYAQKANAFLHWWRDHGFKNWGQDPDDPSDGNALGYAELLAGHALFYDWCYDYLSSAERAYHARALYHLITDEERMYLHPYGDWRNGRFDNNHLGVIFGAVGLAALALDQQDPVFDQTARDSIAWFREKAATRVREYLDASFPEGGAGIEGMLYAMYGMNLALPYALATQRLRTVAPGYDALPWSMRVDAPRNAYQSATWLYYEQLPYNTCGATPLNDTALPPHDMNPSFRAWPWLMAFSSAEYPNAAIPFFHTIYPPAMIDQAVTAAFDYRTPDAISDPFDIRQVTGPEPKARAGALNSCGILLAWPEDDLYPTLDPSAFAPSRYFPGRGITYFRSGIQQLAPDGTLAWTPDSCLITFECRQHPTYPPYFSQWSGHTQQDVNHFTLFFAQQPLFYDSGYAGYGHAPSFYSYAHSLHEIRIGSGSWQGFAGYRTMGTALGSAIGSGIAPSSAGGINTECWSESDVTRSVRRMVVLPRPGAPAPYVLLHDDFELTASGHVRALFQTGNEYEGGAANAPQVDGPVVRWQKEDAAAVLALLAPSGTQLATTYVAPNDTTHWPVHWVVRAQVPTATTRHQLVSLIEPRYASDSSPELIDDYLQIPTSDPEGLAYQIACGSLTDVVAFRPYDSSADWTIYPQGYPPIEVEEATLVALRFETAGRAAGRLCAGLMNGGRIAIAGRVMATLGGGRTASLAFSDAGAATWPAGKTAPAFLVDLPPPETPDDPDRGGCPGPDEAEEPAPTCVRLIPNPLRPGAQLEWQAPAGGGPVSIGVYDTSGRLLRTLTSGDAGATLRTAWDGRSSRGEAMATGVYLLRIQQGEQTWGRRVLILRN